LAELGPAVNAQRPAASDRVFWLQRCVNAQLLAAPENTRNNASAPSTANTGEGLSDIRLIKSPSVRWIASQNLKKYEII
jgi:hypothetical protein